MPDKKLTPEQLKQLNNNAAKMQEAGYSADEIKEMASQYFEKFASVEGEPVNFTTASDGAQEESTTTSQEELKSSEGVGVPFVNTLPKYLTPTTEEEKQQAAQYNRVKNDVSSIWEQKVKPTYDKVYQQEIAKYQPILEEKKALIQSKIDSGEMSLEDGQKELENAVKSADSATRSRTENSEEVKALYDTYVNPSLQFIEKYGIAREEGSDNIPKDYIWGDGAETKTPQTEGEDVDIKNVNEKGLASVIYNDLVEGYTGGVESVARLVTGTVAYLNPEVATGGQTADRGEAFDIGFNTEIAPEIKNALDQALKTAENKEQAQAIRDSFVGGAVTGLARSIYPMMTAYGVGFFTQGFTDSYKEVDQLAPDIPVEDKMLYSTVQASVALALERFGLQNALSKKSLLGEVTNRVIKEAYSKMGTVTPKVIQDVLEPTVRGFLSEGLTGGSQEFVSQSIKESLNMIEGTDIFDKQTWGEQIRNSLKAGVQEGIGGGIMTTPQIVSNIITNKGELNTESIKAVEDISKSTQAAKDLKIELDRKGVADSKEIVNKLELFAQANQKTPESMTDEQKVQAIPLIIEKEELKAEIEGKDEALSQPIKERIKAIDEQLISIVNPQATTGAKTDEVIDEVNTYIEDIASQARISDKVQSTLDKVEKAEYINDNEVDAAIDAILSEIDRVEKSNYSDQSKKQITDKLFNLAEQLDNYEFRTKTETVKVTEAKATLVPIESPTRAIKVEQFFNNTPAEIGGEVVKLSTSNGRVEAKTKNGTVVIDTPSLDLKEGGVELDENSTFKSATFVDRFGTEVKFTGDTGLDLAIKARENRIGTVPSAMFEALYEEVSRDVEVETPYIKGSKKVSEPTTETKVEPEGDVTAAKKELSDVWQQWKASQKGLGISYNPKSSAEMDVKLTKAFIKYVRAIGAKTANDVIVAIKSFTNGEVVLSESDASDLLPRQPKVIDVEKENEGLTPREKVKQGFEEYLDSKEKERKAKQELGKLKAKVKRAGKLSKGKTTISNTANTFSKININGVEDKAVLKEVERIADELSSSTPKVTVKEINDAIESVTKAKEKAIKPLEERVKANTKKRLSAETPLQSLNSEIERQALLAEVIESEEDVDKELLRELDEELPFTFSGSEVTSMDLAKKAKGNLKRATTALQKALDTSKIDLATYNKVKDDLQKAIDEYNKDVEKIKQAEKTAFEKAKKEVALPENKIEKEIVQEFLRTAPFEDAAWYAKANEVIASIQEGVIPYKEMTNLRAYAAYKSKAATEVSEQLEKVKADDKNIEQLQAELATKGSAQKERNILGLTAKKVWNNVYQPMVASVKKAEKITDDLLKDYKKAVPVPSVFAIKSKREYNKDMSAAGIVALYLREQSLAGEGISADGVEVGNRDIFGIMLGNEKAMEAAGLDEKDKQKFRNGRGVANYTKSDAKLLAEIYETLKDKELGYVDVANIGESSLKTPRQKAALREAIKMFEDTSKMQEASNLTRGVPFKFQNFYVPTRRVGGDTKTTDNKPSNATTTFSSLASAGKEKITESLDPTIGAFEFNLNKLVINHAAEVSMDYVFSQNQPVMNAFLNSVVSQTTNAVPARAIKNDYNESLKFEVERSKYDLAIANTLLSARYALPLFNPLRSLYEVIAVTSASLVRQRTTKAITDMFSKESWNTMKKLEDTFGIKIADFKSAEIERKSLKEGLSTEVGLVKLGRYVMSSPEYFTAITNFMPVFRAEFQKLTGETFDMEQFLNTPEYLEQFREEILQSVKVGQEITERYQGSKVKAGTRRTVEVLPKWLSKDGMPITVRADSTAGRLIGFFGNYTYREQGEFFTSLKFVAKAIKEKDAKLGTEETANLLAVMTNASLYGFLSTLTYIGSQILLGSDDEKEEAIQEFEELMTVEGLLKNISSQIAFLGMSKYGKVSRGLGIITLSSLYHATDDEDIQGLIMEILEGQFYVYKPLNVERKADATVMLANEVLPALSYLLKISSDFVISMKEMQEDPQAAVAVDMGINLINVVLATTVGTQLPMTREIKKAIKKYKEDNAEIQAPTRRSNVNF